MAWWSGIRCRRLGGHSDERQRCHKDMFLASACGARQLYVSREAWRRCRLHRQGTGKTPPFR